MILPVILPRTHATIPPTLCFFFQEVREHVVKFSDSLKYLRVSPCYCRVVRTYVADLVYQDVRSVELEAAACR